MEVLTTQDRVVKTGIYWIVNKEFNDCIFKLGSTEGGPICARLHSIPEALFNQWRVARHEDGRYSIKNVGTGLYACSPHHARANDPVEGKASAQLWKLTKTGESTFSIESSESRFCWGLADMNVDRKVVLYSTTGIRHPLASCQWEIEPLHGNKPSIQESSCTTPDSHCARTPVSALYSLSDSFSASAYRLEGSFPTREADTASLSEAGSHYDFDSDSQSNCSTCIDLAADISGKRGIPDDCQKQVHIAVSSSSGPSTVDISSVDSDESFMAEFHVNDRSHLITPVHPSAITAMSKTPDAPPLIMENAEEFVPSSPSDCSGDNVISAATSGIFNERDSTNAKVSRENSVVDLPPQGTTQDLLTNSCSSLAVDALSSQVCGAEFDDAGTKDCIESTHDAVGTWSRGVFAASSMSSSGRWPSAMKAPRGHKKASNPGGAT